MWPWRKVAWLCTCHSSPIPEHLGPQAWQGQGTRRSPWSWGITSLLLGAVSTLASVAASSWFCPDRREPEGLARWFDTHPTTQPPPRSCGCPESVGHPAGSWDEPLHNCFCSQFCELPAMSQACREMPGAREAGVLSFAGQPGCGLGFGATLPAG